MGVTPIHKHGESAKLIIDLVGLLVAYKLLRENPGWVAFADLFQIRLALKFMLIMAYTFEPSIRYAMKAQAKVEARKEPLDSALVKVFILSLLIALVQFFTAG